MNLAAREASLRNQVGYIVPLGSGIFADGNGNLYNLLSDTWDTPISAPQMNHDFDDHDDGTAPYVPPLDQNAPRKMKKKSRVTRKVRGRKTKRSMRKH